MKVVKKCPRCESLFVCSIKGEGCAEAKQCYCEVCIPADREGCNSRILRSGNRLKEDTS